LFFHFFVGCFEKLHDDNWKCYFDPQRAIFSGFLPLVLLVLRWQPTEAIVITINNAQRNGTALVGRERISLNTGWRFFRSTTNPDNLVYEVRFDRSSNNTQALKRWILPSANEFISDPTKRHQRPIGNPVGNVSFVLGSFDDSAWEAVTLPHD
jgi:beta-galactosidase